MSSKTASISTFRFDQMASLIYDRVDNPAESGVERYVGLEHLDADSLRIRRWGEITDVESTKLRFQPGDIIFGKRRVYQRKLAVADFEGICSAHAMVLRAKANVVLPGFLPFFMQSDRFMERALAISVGSLSPTINWTTLAAEEFALPPIEEQLRIVLVMNTLERLIDSLVDSVDRGYQCYQAVLRDSFPATGAMVTSGTLCPFITSGSRGWAKYYSASGATFFRITNMRRRSIRPDWVAVKFVAAPTDGEAERTRACTDDVLISVTADVGMVTLVTGDFPVSHVNQHIAILRPDPEKVCPQFLAYFLASEFGEQQFRRFNDHGAKAGLNLQNLAALAIPAVPLEDQRMVVRRVRALDEARDAVVVRLEHTRSLRKRVLGAAIVERLR